MAALCLAFSAAHAQTNTLPTVKVESQRDTYRPVESDTANRTDTPSLQSAQNTQTVSKAVLDDQNALQLTEAIRNVSGVQLDFGFNGAAMPLTILRGFSSVSMTAMGSMSGSSTYYIDGSKVSGVPINMANVQAVEVVKGPASVLYGRSEPGGLINVVSKPIAAVPELSLEQTVGQYGLSRTSVEASGALNENRSLRGRVAGSYTRSDSIRDFVQDKLGAFTASLQVAIRNTGPSYPPSM
jgi:iron complex outermembrane receptor protein